MKDEWGGRFAMPKTYAPKLEAEINLTIVAMRMHCAAMIAHYAELYNSLKTPAMKEYLAQVIEAEMPGTDFENN